MSSYSDLIVSRGPERYWRLGEAPWGGFENFRGTAGDQMDLQHWSTSQVYSPDAYRAEYEDNHFVLECDNRANQIDAIQISQRSILIGDFDIELSYSSFTEVGSALCYMFLQVNSAETGGVGYNVGLRILSNDVIAFWADFQGGGSTATARTNTKGRVRLVRAGTNLKAYVDDDAGSWTEILSGTVLDDAMTPLVVVYAWSDGDSVATAHLTEMRLNSGTVQRKLQLDHSGNDLHINANGRSGTQQPRLATEDGSSLSLDGTAAQYLTTGTIFGASDTQGSLEFWFQTTNNTEQAIFASSDTASTTWFVLVDFSADGRVIWRTQTNTVNNQLWAQVFGLNDGKPHHCVISSNGSAISIYIDGALATLDITSGSNDGTWFAGVLNRDNVTLGCLNYGSIEIPWLGELQEIAYYSTPLTAQQIGENYQAGLVLALDYTLPESYAELPVADGAVDYWRLGGPLWAPKATDKFIGNDGDPPDPGVWNDGYAGADSNGAGSVQISSNKLAISANNNSGLTYVRGIIGYHTAIGDCTFEVELDSIVNTGTGSQIFPIIAQLIDEDPIQELYIGPYRSGASSFWYAYDGVAGNQVVRSVDYGRLRIQRIGSNVTLDYWNGSAWANVKTRASAPTSRIRLVIRAQSNGDGDSLSSANVVKIDKSVGSTSRYQFLNEFEDGAGPFINVNDIKASRLRLAGKDDGSILLNGTDQYAFLNTADYRDTDTQGAVEYWIKTSAPNEVVILASADRATGTKFIDFTLYNGKARIGVLNGATVMVVEANTALLNDGEIHHVVVQSDAASISIYVDGAVAALTVVAGTNNGLWFSTVPDRDNVVIGALDYNSTVVAFFDGLIDEVAVYDAPLTQDQIARHYAAGQERRAQYDELVIESDPTHYFRMDDHLPDLTPYAMTDDFADPGPGGYPDHKKWAILKDTPKVELGRAVLHTTPLYEQLRLAHLLQGDFSITFQWEVGTTLVAGETFTFMARNVDDAGEIRYIYADGNLGRITGSDNTTYNYSSLYWDDGFFKIERIGTGAGAIKLYYKRLLGDSWIQRSSFSDFTLNADAYLYVYTNVGTKEARVLDVQATADSGTQFVAWRAARDEVGNAYVLNALSDEAKGIIADQNKASSFIRANSDYLLAQEITQPGTSNYTMEMWVRLDNVNTTQALAGFGTGGVASEPCIRFLVTVSAWPNIIIDDGTTQKNTLVGSTYLVANKPFHMAFTIDRDNDELKLFVNGVQASVTVDITGLGSLTSTLADLYFGRYVFTPGNEQYFDGDLDEIAIYERVLPASELLEHFRAGMEFVVNLEQLKAYGFGFKYSPGYIDQPDYQAVVAATSPYFQWPLNETDGTPLDISGNDRHGTSGGTAPAGVNSQLISQPDDGAYAISAGSLRYNTLIANPQTYAIAMVIVTEVAGGTLAQHNVAVNGASHDRDFYIDTNGNLRFYWWSGAQNSIAGTTTVSDGRPHHVAIVLSGGTATIYVDGKVDVSASATPYNQSAYWIFGVGSNATPKLPFEGAEQFVGIMDEITYWHGTVPSAEDIKDQYAAVWHDDKYGRAVARGRPVSQYRFDDTTEVNWVATKLLMHFSGAHASTTTWWEETGKTATNVGGAAIFRYNWRSQGSSLYLNGTTSYLTFPDNADFVIGAFDFSIEAWVLPSAIGAFMPVLVHSDDTVNGWFIDIRDTGEVRFLAHIGGVWGVYLQSSEPLVATEWQHIVVDRIGDKYTMFIDGREVDTITNSGALLDSADLFQIGHIQINAGTHRYFQGYIDEVRFRIGQSGYHSQRDGFVPPRFHPDDKYRDSAAARITLPPAEVLRGLPSLIYGDRVGAAIYIDGTTDAESAVDLGFNDNYADLTIELWFQADVGGVDHGAHLVSKDSYFAATVTDFPVHISLGATGNLSAVLSKGDDFSADLTLSGTTTNGSPTHVVLVFSDQDRAELWINGVKVDNDDTINWSLSTTTHNWTIGAPALGNGGGLNTQNATNVRLDEVAIYDRALASTEIEAHYAAGANPGGDLAVTLDQVPAEGLTNQLTTVPDAFQVALDNLSAWAIANDIAYEDPALVVDLQSSTAEGVVSEVSVPNPGIAVGLQNAKGEATILKVNVVQGAVSAALLAARAEGTALMPPAINSAITLTLPRAEALPGVALAQVDLSGLISNIGAAISQAQVVPPIALVGGELAVIGAAQANGQAVNPSTLLAGLIATLSEAMADTSGVDMIGVASAITASLAQATAEQIAKGLLTQLGGAAVTLPSTAGEALSSDVAVTIDFAAINIGAIDALAETNGPNISLGDFQVGLDAAVALGFTPEVTVTVDFGPGEIEKESLVYRFQLEDVVYKITYASAVALKNRASMVMRKDEESDVKMATYGDDVYQSTQDNEV